MPKTTAIKQLKTYFKNRDNVLMAFLFGSQTKERSSKRSDWDIGIYLKPPKKAKLLEWESEYVYPETNEIWSDLTNKLKTDNVDVVVLNCSASHIADTIIKGMPLVIKNRGLYLNFMLHTTSEAIDYRQMVNEYYDIFQRSKSLSPEDQKNLKIRLIYLQSELAEIVKFKTLTIEQYLHNRDVKRNVERWVENLVNCSLDISKILLASQHQEIPSTYKEIFLHLSRLSGFSKNLAEKLANWAGLRNIIAHEYLDLRWSRQIKPFINQAEPYLQKFIKVVKKYLK